MADAKKAAIKYRVLIGHNCPRGEGEELRFDEGQTVTSYPVKFLKSSIDRGLIEEVE